MLQPIYDVRGCSDWPLWNPLANSAGARMKAGVVGSKRKIGTRTEQCLELELIGARTYTNPQRESIGVRGRLCVFSKLVL